LPFTRIFALKLNFTGEAWSIAQEISNLPTKMATASPSADLLSYGRRIVHNVESGRDFAEA
jgi:hypothetical protein